MSHNLPEQDFYAVLRSFQKTGDEPTDQLFKVYVDMDGVITDFVGSVTKMGYAAGLGPEATEEEKLSMYDAIDDAGPEFWSNMAWTKDGKALWEVVKPYGPRILTSPGQFQYSRQGKQEWVTREIPGTPLFLSEEKYEYVEPWADTILIDDMEKNVLPWREAGGIGIVHESSEKTEQELLSLLQKI